MEKKAIPAFIWPVSLLAVVLSFALGTFQNCSKVGFSSSEKSLADTDTPLEVGLITISAGLREVPPLKMMFIVDNSYTMKANQLNLSRSFGKMFDPSSTKSLAPFAVSAFLLNTAQKTPGYKSAELSEIDSLQLTQAQLESLSYSSLMTAHRNSLNSGALPGDNLGFATSLLANPSIAEFLPAPVLGVKDNGAGMTAVQRSMEKARNQLADAFAAEFQARLVILDNARIPTNPDGSQKYNSILDAESGMCAMARVLRNNQAFVSSGEIAAFVVVTDEDEADQEGANCIQKHQTWTGNEPVIKGKCEHRRSVVSYSVPTTANDVCKITYQNGYRYKYSWSEPATTYTYPRTQIGFSKSQATYKLIQTKVVYYNKTCVPVMRDGIKVGENCTHSAAQNATRDGDQTANCQTFAQSISASASSDNGFKPTCTRLETSVTSCASTNPNCIIGSAFVTANQVVDGRYVTGAECTNRAKSIAGAITDGSKPVTCTAVANGSGNGACPSQLVSLGCTSSTANAAKSATGTLLFANSGDGGSTKPVGACGSLQTPVYNLVKQSFPSAPSNGTCEITSVNTTSTSPVHQPNPGCATQASNYCSQNSSTARACSGAVISGTTTWAKTNLPALEEQIACTDLCSSPRSNLCAPHASVTVTPTMTIEEYFKARYGAGTTCQATVTTIASQAYTDRLEADKDQICATAPFYYNVQEGSSYFKTGPQLEHVAGSKVDGAGKYVPEMNLPDYINKRSGELFGEASPFVSMFVRKSTDPDGTAGSKGVKYEALAARMGGRTESILAEDFSPALQDLGGIIKDRLERSFTLTPMKAHQKVRHVWIQKNSAGAWQELDPSLWTTSGKTVTLSPLVDFELEDSFKFEFW